MCLLILNNIIPMTGKLSQDCYYLQMIRKLTGTITDCSKDGLLIIELSGVGFLVNCLKKYCPQIGDKKTIYTYLSVKETALDLYGFSDKNELLIFELLLTIPKIGPKTALQILNQADPQLITESVISNDYEYLHKISGLGKKTSEKIVQALQVKKDKLSSVSKIINKNQYSEVYNDAIETLMTLGYDAGKAKKVVTEITANKTDIDLNTVITKSLQKLSSK